MGIVHRFWPSNPSTPGWENDGTDYTLGVDFTVTAECTLKALWFPIHQTNTVADISVWSYQGAPTSPTSPTLVAQRIGLNGTTLGWSTGWTRMPFTADVTLLPGNYRAGITSTTNNWWGGTANYWNSPNPGASGITAGPIRANPTTIAAGQSYFSVGSTPIFPVTTGNGGSNYWVDVEVDGNEPAFVWSEGQSGTFDMSMYADRSAMLADEWSFTANQGGFQRDTESGTATYSPLIVNATSGTIFGTSIPSSTDTIFRNLPSNWYQVTVQVSPNPAHNNNHRIGLLVYENDDNYIGAITRGRGVMVLESGGTHTLGINSFDVTYSPQYYRLYRDLGTGIIHFSYSSDGVSFTPSQANPATTTQTVSNPRLALYSSTTVATTVTFGSVEVLAVTTPAPEGQMLLGASTLGDLRVGGAPASAAWLNGLQVYKPTLSGSHVGFTVTSQTFEPEIEMHVGATAQVYWADDDGNVVGTGTTPTLDFGYPATRTIQMHVLDGTTPAFDQVRVVNVGFDNSEDGGQYAIGTSYNKLNREDVTGVQNINLCTDLAYFCAATPTLVGHLDFSGMSQLEFVECYHAQVNSVDLTGCTGMIRLCLEGNDLTSPLDLNPVSANLRDLRAAAQTSNSMTMTTITGTMAQLYHFCIRGQNVTNMIPMSKLTAVEECWIWETNQTTADMPISPAARSFPLYGNSYDQASVDNILVGLDTYSLEGAFSTVDLTGSAVPSATGMAARSSLQGKGWTVNVSS